MKKFLNLLNELNLQNRHDPIKVKAILVHMAIKNHLRNPDNFRKMLESKTRTINFDDIEAHPSLKEHLKGHKFQFVGPNKSHYGYYHRKKIVVAGFSSLTKKRMDKVSFEQTHSDFLKEYQDNFPITYHEYTHLEQDKKGMDFQPASKYYTRYYNEPKEVEAHTREFDFTLGRAIRRNPEKFSGVKSNNTYKAIKILDDHETPGLKRFSRAYKVSTPENQRLYKEIVNRHLTRKP